MQAISLKTFFTVLILSIFLWSCGGSGSESSTDSTSTDSEESSTEVKEITDPDELAQAITDVYASDFKALEELLKSETDAATIKSKLEEMKEASIQKYVKYGAMKAKMSDADQGKVNMGLMSKMGEVGQSDEGKARFKFIFQEKFKELNKEDKEIGKLLSSFNILTQYADYELLKKTRA